MPGIERLTIALPAPMAAELRQAVEAGEYASTSEAVRDALREWRLKRVQREAAIEALRKAWDEGLASGDAGPLDLEELKVEARRFEQAMKL